MLTVLKRILYIAMILGYMQGAVFAGNVPVSGDKLVDRPKRAEGINEQDPNGLTPLLRAVGAGNVELARRLIEQGADVNERGSPRRIDWSQAILERVERTPNALRIWAAWARNGVLIAGAAGAGSALWTGARFAWRRLPGGGSANPLVGALPPRVTVAVQLVLAGSFITFWAIRTVSLSRIDPAGNQNENNNEIAIEREGNALHGEEDVSVLPETGAQLEGGGYINDQDLAGYTPLLVAALNSNIEMVGLLLGQGANPNLLTLGGESPLFFAVYGDSLEIVRLLLGYGADPYYVAPDGRTLLETAEDLRQDARDRLRLCGTENQTEEAQAQRDKLRCLIRCREAIVSALRNASLPVYSADEVTEAPPDL